MIYTTEVRMLGEFLIEAQNQAISPKYGWKGVLQITMFCMKY